MYSLGQACGSDMGGGSGNLCFLFQRGVHVFCVLVFGSQGLKSELGGGVQLCTEDVWS